MVQPLINRLIFIFRLWITTAYVQAPGSPGHVRAQQIGYHDILPARLESNPDAFGPKYESLNETLKTFNQKILRGEEEIPGRHLCSIFCYRRFGFIAIVLELVGILWPLKGQKGSHFYHKLHVNE